jgi:hypothetical protein
MAKRKKGGCGKAGKAKAKSVSKNASAANSVKRKLKEPRGKPFQPGNPWRFKPGQSGNPNGRPKLLSGAYQDWLAAEDENGMTNASHVALALGARSISGDVNAAKELRSATEGTRVTTWQDEVVALLKSGQVTPEDVIEELGDDDKGIAEAILVAAGVQRHSDSETPPASAVATDPEPGAERGPA